MAASSRPDREAATSASWLGTRVVGVTQRLQVLSFPRRAGRPFASSRVAAAPFGPWFARGGRAIGGLGDACGQPAACRGRGKVAKVRFF
jgi:hypothetical protein